MNKKIDAYLAFLVGQVDGDEKDQGVVETSIIRNAYKQEKFTRKGR